MKRCPQCQNMFDVENSFCLNDGTPLIAEPPQTAAYNFPPPIPQQSSFVVDLSPQTETPTQFPPIPPISAPHQTAKKSTNNYVVLLLVGLLLGSAVAVAAFFIIKDLGEKDTAVNSNSSKIENSKKSSVNNDFQKTEKSSNTNLADNVRDEDEKYNGRVIMINANLRSAPSSYADELETLPLDERIVIGRRESPNSPWYRVTCEHGTSGWMHGNTIEFTR